MLYGLQNHPNVFEFLCLNTAVPLPEELRDMVRVDGFGREAAGGDNHVVSLLPATKVEAFLQLPYCGQPIMWMSHLNPVEFNPVTPRQM